LGDLYFELKQYNNAAAAYTRVLTLDRSNAHAYRRLGWSLNELARFEDAIAPLKMALQLGPDDRDAYRELGYAWRKLGQSDLAIAAYTELMRVDAHSEVPHFGLADVYFYNLKNFSQAIDEYRVGLQLGGGDVSVFLNLGAAYEALGNNDEALSSYQRALQLDPKSRDAHFSLGLLWAKRGESRLAEIEAEILKMLAVDTNFDANNLTRSSEREHSKQLLQPNGGLPRYSGPVGVTETETMDRDSREKQSQHR